MDKFRSMISDDTLCKELDYRVVNRDSKIIKDILPKNTYHDTSSRYFNWLEIDGVLYYFKRFNFNEFIGEELCKILDLSSVHYDLANIKGGIQMISRSFIDKDKTYCNIKNLPSYLRKIEKKDWYVYTLELLIESLFKAGYSKEIIDKLIDDIMKMSAIDYYARQTDRFFNNYMFMIDNKVIGLAPLYDFGESFSFRGGSYVCNETNYAYNNELFDISWNNFFANQLLEKYPNLRVYLSKMGRTDLKKIIMDIVTRYNLLIDQELLEIYDYEENMSKDRIKKLVK